MAAASTPFVIGSVGASKAAGRHSNPYYCEPICLVRGALVETREGARPIEDIRIGDEVMTDAGGFEKVVWVGSQSFSRDGEPWASTIDPVRISKGAIADQMPHRDLYVSPKHALYIDGYLVPARYLVNGSTIAQGVFEGEVVDYFHIRCERHEVVFAEGLPVETLQWRDPAMLDAPAAEDLTIDLLEPYAPVLGYWNRTAETIALLRRVTSFCVDVRDPIQVIKDRLALRAGKICPAI